MMTFVDGWKFRSKLPRPSKKLWTTFNRCSLNSSITGITMIPEVTMMRKNILAMNSQGRRSQRRVLLWTLKSLKASSSNRIPSSEGWTKKVGAVRPYPLEWDSVPYPSKFKPPTLHTYDGKSSTNQHIYYFRSQTGNVIDNDVIMARLFIGTLKGVAFDWFWSLPPGSAILGLTWKPDSFLVSMRKIPR